MDIARIKHLSPLVANQIAAGEVIERPASVVKELLENALDARADSIHIEIGFGGLNQIKVSDNGQGIWADDLPLAIAPHATSKISILDDLSAIESMGFRGEALASIAAVSQLRIYSKPCSQEHAMMLESSASDLRILPCARALGTTIEVLNLFFNAPVRKKFLKPAKHEFQAIEVMVKRFALSAPHIALTLQHDGKTVLKLPAANTKEALLTRLRKILGGPFVEEALFLEVEQGTMSLWGWVSTPQYQISQSDKQWIYVNHRMVKDKLLLHAIKQAYSDHLFPGRYPACLLYFTIPQSDVDVNVHPTKHELRFQQPRLVHDFIFSHISTALHKEKEDKTGTHCDLSVSQVKKSKLLEYRSALTWDIQNINPIQDWLRLNAGYAIIFIQSTYYLLDIKRGHTEMLLDHLLRQNLPLSSRPLLVPLRYTFTPAESLLLDAASTLWQQAGVQLQQISPTDWVVRSIPQALPQLDIEAALHSFLHRSSSEKIQEKELIRILAESHSTEWCEEEITHLKEYISHQMAHLRPLSWCIALDETACTHILREVCHV